MGWSIKPWSEQIIIQRCEQEFLQQRNKIQYILKALHSSVMRTIRFMSGIPNSPDLFILCSTHPTPFSSASNRSGRTLDMITSFHFLNPTTTVTWLCVRSKPYTRWFIGGEKLVAYFSPVLYACSIRVSGSATVETGFALACWTSEVRRCIYNWRSVFGR